MALTAFDFEKMMKKKGFTGNHGFGSSSGGGLLGSLLLDHSSSPLPLPLMMMMKKKKAYKASEDDDNHNGAAGFRFSVCPHIACALLEELFGLSLMGKEEGGKMMKQPEKKNTSGGLSIKEDEEGMTVKVEMPGLGKEDVKVRVVNNTLLIEGDDQKETDDDDDDEEEEEENDDKGKKKNNKWKMYLPDDEYKTEEMKAVMKNGVLTVRVPKLKVEEGKDVIHVLVED